MCETPHEHIVHELVEHVDGCARHPDKVCDLCRFVSHTKKCRNFYSIVSLQSQFEYTTIANLFLRCHSHRASGGLNRSRIMTAKQPKLQLKVLFNPFKPTRYKHILGSNGDPSHCRLITGPDFISIFKIVAGESESVGNTQTIGFSNILLVQFSDN